VTARRVLLWRHGRTAWNVEHRFQRRSDLPLDEVGHRQAAVGPLANWHWSELRQDERGWRLRGHDVGPAGPCAVGAAGLGNGLAADAEALDAGPAGVPAR
jgi:hypothetical protein